MGKQHLDGGGMAVRTSDVTIEMLTESKTAPWAVAGDEERGGDRAPSALRGHSTNHVVEAWSFSTTEIADAVQNRQMLSPSLDLSNACNLNCPYCFVEDKASSAKRRRPLELSLDETYAVLADFAAAGARTVNLVGAGEPTVDPHFEPIVERIAALNMRTMLFTNGIRIADDPRLASWLLERRASVAIKVNSRRPDLQDFLAGRRGYTKQRDRALRVLLDAGFASASPTRLAIDVLVMVEVADELPELYDWCRTEGVHPIFAEYLPTGRTEGGVRPAVSAEPDDAPRYKLERLDASARAKLASELATVDARHGIPRVAGECAYFGGERCTQLLGVYVDIQGWIWPCVARTQLVGGVAHREPLGNIRDPGTHASKLWLSHPTMEHIRREYTGACPYKLPVPAGDPAASRPIGGVRNRLHRLAVLR